LFYSEASTSELAHHEETDVAERKKKNEKEDAREKWSYARIKKLGTS